MPTAKPTVVDLFAGAGLFSSGFRNAGFKITRAIEFDCVAAATYAANVGNEIEVRDIRDARPIGKCEVIIAGPPCQGFSSLGACHEDDPRNSLGLQVVNWAIVMRPRVVVIENVPQFLTSPAAVEIKRRLERLHYRVEEVVLDAAFYGVPQHRRRAFLIAHQSHNEFKPPKRYRSIKTVKDAFDGLSAKADGKNHHYSPEPSAIALARMCVIPPCGDKRDIMKIAPDLAPPSWWRTPSEVTDVWGRMDWSRPSNTVRTCVQNASKGRYIHPTEHRVVSLREAARLQTIPDDWQFVGLPTQISRQIGNGVPPALGMAIAKSVLSLL